MTYHQKGRPRLKRTRFTAMLIEANAVDPDHFAGWAFCPGMLFGSPHKWWGDRGRRDFPHEGLDFCLYQDRSGQIRRLDAQTRIPVMHAGVVVAMFTDYLGRAIIIEHQNPQLMGETFLSVYAHTRPQAHLGPGVRVREGDIIATIADTGHSKADILPHLHFSLGLPSPDLVYEPFVWNIMRDPDRVTLLNPMAAIDGPCRMLDTGHAACYGPIQAGGGR